MFLFLAWAFAPLALAAPVTPQSLCSALLTHSTDLRRIERIVANNRALHETLAPTIRDARLDPSPLPVEDALHHAFTRYVSLRVESLAPLFAASDAAWIEIGRRVANTLSRTRFEHLERLDGIYSVTHDTITLTFPHTFKHTLSHYITLAHETEHVIQMLLLEPFSPTEDREPTPPSLASLEHYLLEKGAMTAEQQFMQLLAQDTFERAVVDLRGRIENADFGESFEPEVTHRLQRLQDSRNLDTRTYIEAEQARGRYHHSNYRESVLVNDRD